MANDPRMNSIVLSVTCMLQTVCVQTVASRVAEGPGRALRAALPRRFRLQFHTRRRRSEETLRRVARIHSIVCAVQSSRPDTQPCESWK